MSTDITRITDFGLSLRIRPEASPKGAFADVWISPLLNKSGWWSITLRRLDAGQFGHFELSDEELEAIGVWVSGIFERRRKHIAECET